MGAERVDAIIVGAGAAGLACAARLAARLGSVVVVERHGGPGRETSSRNSGVVHAGLYYPQGSLKARLCVEGREQLYRWCRARGVAHRRTGKLVVATDEAEASQLAAIRRRAVDNGAGDVTDLDGAQLRRLEPEVSGIAALWSPESGIVDAHELMDTYIAEARQCGADFAWRTRLESLEPRRGGWLVETRGPHGERFPIETPTVVNAAGLAADRIAELAGLDVDRLGWRQQPCKGDYFALTSGAPRPSTALLYPLPVGGGLGIHLTTDLGGRCTAGPDATYVEHIDYAVDERKAAPFAESVARYLPRIRPEHLTPDYSGIRPKLAKPGESFRDFVIEESSAQGAPGLIHLIGIESPGLTASLAIADRVAALIERG